MEQLRKKIVQKKNFNRILGVMNTILDLEKKKT